MSESKEGDQRSLVHGWMSAQGNQEPAFTDAGLNGLTVMAAMTANAFSSTCLQRSGAKYDDTTYSML